MHHERLRVYEVLMRVAQRVPDLIARLPKGEGYIVDQFKRALASGILNLTEGNGRASPRERRRFFDIAIASIAETASAVDIMLAYRLIPEAEAVGIKADLNIAYAMAINLKRSAI